MGRGQSFRLVFWTLLSLQTVAVMVLPSSDCGGKDCSRSRPPSSSPPSSSAAVKSSQPPQDLLSQFTQVNSPNSGERKHRDAGAVLPFIGLTGSSEQSRSCCKNGGTCILGSFCACPPFFTGRSCEYDTRIRTCDVIPHGEWVQKGCSYCRCGYGILHCFPNVFHKNCDDSDEKVRWYRSSAVGVIPSGRFLHLLMMMMMMLLLSLFRI